MLSIDGELHVRRANNSEAIPPQPLSATATLVINGSRTNDTVTMEASLNGTVAGVQFKGNSGNDRLDPRLMTFGVTMTGDAGRILPKEVMGRE